MFLFSVILYLSTKIPFVVLRDVQATPAESSGALEGASIARPWGLALIASFAGLAVGIFFLSFSYHYVLWIYIGLSGALYGAVRAHYPAFKVRLGLPDLALVFAIDIAIIVGLYLYTRSVVG